MTLKQIGQYVFLIIKIIYFFIWMSICMEEGFDINLYRIMNGHIPSICNGLTCIIVVESIIEAIIVTCSMWTIEYHSYDKTYHLCETEKCDSIHFGSFFLNFVYALMSISMALMS